MTNLTLNNSVRLFFLLFSIVFSNLSSGAYRNSQQAPLYSGPSEKAPLSSQSISKHTGLEVLRKTGNFTLVRTQSGELGWIDSSFVEFFSDATPKPVQAETQAPQPTITATPENADTPKKEAPPQSVSTSSEAAERSAETPAAEEQIINKPITEKKEVNIHQQRKANAIVEVISPDSDPNTKAMLLGQPAQDTSTPIEDGAENAAEANKNERNEQQKLLDSIDNALNQQAPTGLAEKPAENLAPNDHQSSTNSEYIFDSSPHANRLELLVEENIHLRTELEKAKNYILKNIPTKDTQTIFEESELLQSQLVLLRTENQRLLEIRQDKKLFNGMLIALLSFILGYFIAKILSNRRKKGNW